MQSSTESEVDASRDPRLWKPRPARPPVASKKCHNARFVLVQVSSEQPQSSVIAKYSRAKRPTKITGPIRDALCCNQSFPRSALEKDISSLILHRWPPDGRLVDLTEWPQITRKANQLRPDAAPILSPSSRANSAVSSLEEMVRRSI